MLENHKMFVKIRLKDSTETPRSSRELKPRVSSGRDGEWLISPKYQTKRGEKHDSPQEKKSPRSELASPKSERLAFIYQRIIICQNGKKVMILYFFLNC